MTNRNSKRNGKLTQDNPISAAEGSFWAGISDPKVYLRQNRPAREILARYNMRISVLDHLAELYRGIEKISVYINFLFDSQFYNDESNLRK